MQQKCRARVVRAVGRARAGGLHGSAGRALELLGQCVEHTPTLVELYTFQAKVLKHAGDLQGAVAASDKARSMDLNDRWGLPC